MSLLYQAAGFFTEGKITMVQNSNIHYVEINITTKGFEFVGSSIAFTGINKDSSGFYTRILWSDIRDIKKSKTRLIHVVIIETLDTFYTIIPMDPLHKSSLGISSTKKHSMELLATIYKAKAQVKQIEKSKDVFCSN